MKWLKIIIGICLIGILFNSAWALDNPEGELAYAIEDYVLTKYPDWIGYDIKVTFKYADKILEGLGDLEGDVDFRVVEVYKDFKPIGNVIFPIEVISAGSTQKIFVRARVEVFKNIVVADRRIKRGGEIVVDDLTLETRDIAVLPQKYFEEIAQVANTEAKTTIPRNSTIFEWMIKEIPLVHRGDEVAILVTAPNMLLKTKGVALEDGYLGKKMKVKSKESKKTLEGSLISATVVEVKLK